MLFTSILNECLFFVLFCFSSLRPRTSSSSSQPERAVSPLVVSSTHSLEAMPRFALSTDDEGKLTKKSKTWQFFAYQFIALYNIQNTVVT